MKHLLLTAIAAVLLVGCGESQQSAPAPEAKPKPPRAKAPSISIHAAAALGNIEAVKQHIDAGTDVNAKGVVGSPLHYAAIEGREGCEEIVELLIANGAVVNAKTSWGTTPLDEAKRYPEIADFFHKHGDKTGEELRSGMTLLHIAAKEGKKETIELLIAKGADVNAKVASGSNKDKIPLDLAITRKHTEIADLLRKHGGKTGEELKAEGK